MRDLNLKVKEVNELLEEMADVGLFVDDEGNTLELVKIDIYEDKETGCPLLKIYTRY